MVDEKLQAWIKQTLDQAVKDLTSQGVYEGLVIEARPAWALPFQILIGQIREQGQATGFDWFICGDLPLGHIHSSNAISPREAARNFALQWQLDAERMEQGGDELAKKAGSLYELTNEDSLWGQE